MFIYFPLSFLKNIFMSLLNLLQYCFCFMFWFSGSETCGILASQPSTESSLPALKEGVLTTGQVGSPFLSLLRTGIMLIFGPLKNEPSVQFSSVAQSCPTLCDPMNRSTPGLPVHHQLQKFTQTHAHGVSDAIQPSHPVIPFSSCPQSLPASESFPMSQLFAWGGQRNPSINHV